MMTPSLSPGLLDWLSFWWKVYFLLCGCYKIISGRWCLSPMVETWQLLTDWFAKSWSSNAQHTTSSLNAHEDLVCRSLLKFVLPALDNRSSYAQFLIASRHMSLLHQDKPNSIGLQNDCPISPVWGYINLGYIQYLVYNAGPFISQK